MNHITKQFCHKIFIRVVCVCVCVCVCETFMLGLDGVGTRQRETVHILCVKHTGFVGLNRLNWLRIETTGFLF